MSQFGLYRLSNYVGAGAGLYNDPGSSKPNEAKGNPEEAMTKPTKASDSSESSDSGTSDSEHSLASKSGSDSDYENSASENRKISVGDSDSLDVVGSPSRKREVAKLAAEQPDLYGIRRSGRQRKEPTRLNIGPSDDEQSKRKRRSGKRNSGRSNYSSDSSDGSSSESSFSDGFKPSAKIRNRVKPQRKAPSRLQRGGRRRQNSSDDGSDSSESSVGDQAVRWSNRSRTSKKVSYKEASDYHTDSDDVIEWTNENEEAQQEKDDAETVQKVYDVRLGKKGATGSKTTRYNVEDHGNPNEVKEGEECQMEKQYLIKWKNWAHIHNTWESEASLKEQKVNGIKKVELFDKWHADLMEWRKHATPEDKEYFELQEEMSDDLYRQHCDVERIVSHTSNKAATSSPSKYPDYLVKWGGLPYADCTWEDGALIVRKAPDAIKEYNLRSKSQKIPNPKFCKAMRYRPKFSRLSAQLSCLGNEDLQLRDYQLEGVNWMIHAWCKWNSVILADEMGLGKTIQIISFIHYLMNAHQLYGPFLVVVPLSTIATWKKEFQSWASDINVVVYLGDIHSRNKIREHEWCHSGNKRLKLNVLITTYEILLKDKSFLGGVQWATLAVDEAHRLKNDDSMLYKTLFEFNTNHRILITGTPLQNSLKELWSLLHFIMPDKFDSWVDFEDRHSSSDKSGFAALHRELEPYLLRRVKKDVEHSLPSKTEQILRVEMSKIQKQFYKWILTKNYEALSKGMKGRAASFCNIIMELKKCCNHATLVRPLEKSEIQAVDRLEELVKCSGKMILLDKLLMRLKDTGHRVLIFSQMVRMLDILAEYLTLRRFLFQRLDGSIKSDSRKQAMDHFNAEGSQDFCFLLSTRAGGLGLNLATADTVIIFDSDWNPQNDLQAQARAHRIGQKNQVSVYRLVTKSSVEEDIIERAKRKMVLDHLVIQSMDTTGRTVLNKGGLGAPGSANANNPFSKEELNAILKFGAQELFNKENEEDEEPQVDIDEILHRAETRNVDDEGNGVADDLLSQFKVVSFDNLEDQEIERRDDNDDASKDWDNIIPLVDRERILEEKRLQELQELNLGPRARKQVTQFNFQDSEDDGKKNGGKDDEESDASDEDTDDEDRKGGKKRGRPSKGGRNKSSIRGFNMQEVRRFIKSYKKFANPMDRLDAIALDAELQEKSQAELQNLARQLLDGCEQAVQEYESKIKDDPVLEANNKKLRGPTLKFGSVPVNAKSVISAKLYLEPLSEVIPKDRFERRSFKLDAHVKKVNWDCTWNIDDDSNLLKGIYEYGMGNWEAMRMDPDLKLDEKILPDGDLKPQAKHLQTRADYLMKILQHQINLQKGIEPKKKVRKPKQTNAPLDKKTKVDHHHHQYKTPEIVEDDISDSDSNNERRKKSPERQKKKVTKARLEDAEDGELLDDEEFSDADHKKKKKKKKEKKKKNVVNEPMHITANNEPIAISAEADDNLDPEIFNQCKEMMRPVKNFLRRLDSADSSLSEKEQLEHTRQCLLKIGDHIATCLRKYSDVNKIKDWRNYLWIFVSKFTEVAPVRLHKIYKHAVKKRVDKMAKKSSKPGKKAKHDDKKKESNAGSSSQHHSKHGTPETWSDTSRDGLSSGHVNRHGHQRPTSGQRDNRDSSHRANSPAERWQLTSPLEREHQNFRPDESVNSYGRPPGQQNSYNARGGYQHGSTNKQYGERGNRYDQRQNHSYGHHYRDDGYRSFKRDDRREGGDRYRHGSRDPRDFRDPRRMGRELMGNQNRFGGYNSQGDRKRRSEDDNRGSYGKEGKFTDDNTKWSSSNESNYNASKS